MKEKRTTHNLREQLHMTAQEFADRFHIPVGTVRNWDTRGTMPAYIEYLIQEILDSKKP